MNLGSDMTSWEAPLRYVKVRGRVYGPYDFERLRHMIRRGQLSRIQELSYDGVTWMPASSEPDLFDASTTVATFPYADTDAAENEANTADGAVKSIARKPTAARWYYGSSHLPVGPVSAERIVELLAQGELTGASLIWRKGMTDWNLLEEAPDFSYLFKDTPSRLRAASDPPQPLELPLDESLEALVAELVHRGTSAHIYVLFIAILAHVAGVVLDVVGLVALWRGIEASDGPSIVLGVTLVIVGLAAHFGGWLVGRYLRRMRACRIHQSLLGLVFAQKSLNPIWMFAAISAAVSVQVLTAALVWWLIDREAMIRFLTS